MRCSACCSVQPRSTVGMTCWPDGTPPASPAPTPTAPPRRSRSPAMKRSSASRKPTCCWMVHSLAMRQPTSRHCAPALARGRTYVGIGALAPADRFFFMAERGSQHWTMGDTVPAGGPLRIRAGGALPANAEVTLRHDGEVIGSSRAGLDRQVTDTGVYRVEVQLPAGRCPGLSRTRFTCWPPGTGSGERRAAVSGAAPRQRD